VQAQKHLETKTMQFGVPQFTDVEDKLIGPLTLKQFLILLAAGGVCLMFYSIFNLSIIFFFLALPVGLLGIVLAFGKYNGRSMLDYFPVFLNYASRPQVRVFKREQFSVSVSFKTEKKEEVQKQTEAPTSRLQKLAYLLDQKAAEEKQLMEKSHGR
jgi:hypothetical protein